MSEDVVTEVIKPQTWGRWRNLEMRKCHDLNTALDSLLLEKHIFKLRMEICVKIQTDY